MSKFNSPSTIKTTNHEGFAAYDMSAKSKLITQVLTSFFNEKKFYGDNSDEMKETIKQVIRQDPEFVSSLAVFARREFNMRSVSHVLTAFLAHEEDGKPFVRETVRGITLRGDDLTETMAFYISEFGKPIPNSLKKGIGEALKYLDEYELAKYKGDGKSVKMRDLLCLCRPKPIGKDQEALWKRCLEGTLQIPMTWETELSKNGNNKETWEKLIASHKVGYMALLRNLRNILQAHPDNLNEVLNYISNPVAVRNSKQFPFRFLSAYYAVQGIGSSKVYTTLDNALNISVDNIPKIPGKTVIAIDVSGSMCCNISNKSDVSCVEIAALLGMIANRICDDAVVYVFDIYARRWSVSSNASILDTVVHFDANGGGTNMYSPVKAMIDEHVMADRIIFLSDNECNYSFTEYNWPWHRSTTVQSIIDEYRREINPDLWVHAIDLQGYGTQQFSGDKTNIIAGWSEKVFDFILLAERGESSLEQEISNYCW